MQSIYKPFLIFSSILFSLSHLNWGKWGFYSNKIYLPILLTGLIILGAFVFQREIKLAKIQQREKDNKKFLRIERLKNKNLERQITILKSLVEDFELAEEKINEIWSEIKDKINLSKIYELPELAITLIEKIVNIKDKYNVKLLTQIEGDLSSLRRINMDDLNQTIDLMIQPIYESFKEANPDNKRDINLFIRENEHNVAFEVMHDNNNLISTEITEWKIKKLLNKYKGSISSTIEQEEDLFVTSLVMEIPKETRSKKII